MVDARAAAWAEEMAEQLSGRVAMDSIPGIEGATPRGVSSG